ncbi:hypothetical protein DOTSEDRAFT_52250 [Dothistroma septosporum NZE10]|uniref:Uncharacterized protein n=1 Tax=Dothistroma septosporum (strain NZE10 / CBS 128990) TaxID=675120 RepID=N1PXG7_DOTSN|nr:hypothetical protein DOTSEDRAFT_52250 [Dothistroma septosporum NZE10]
MANELYTTALGAVREATLEPQGVREDATLVASILLANIERYSECLARSRTEWMIHVQGVSFLAENRGVHQTRTKLGKAIFRKAREVIIENAFCNAVEAPSFVVLYSQAIRYDAHDGMDDQLAILEIRAASLFARYCSGDLDQKLGSDAETYQEDLISWELDLDRVEKQSEQGDGGRRERWQRIRCQTCMIICLRVQAATYDSRWHRETLYTNQARKQSEVAGRERLTAEILRNSGAEIRMLNAARQEVYRSPSSLTLTRHLYVIGVCLIDESRQARLAGRMCAAYFHEQMVSVMALLRHLGQANGDLYSLHILQALQLRQRRISSGIH